MKFQEYKRTRDQTNFFESADFEKNDIVAASEAMREWVEATEKLIGALDRVPEAYGELGGGHETPKVSDNVAEQTIALEVQRVRYVVQEADLANLLSQLHQFSSRINAACENL